MAAVELTYGYDGVGASDKDTFRFRIQDVGELATWQFADQEIQWYIDEYGVKRGILEAIKSLLMKYAKYRDERINNVSSFDSQIYANYAALYETMKRDALRTAIPFLGGISEDVKTTSNKDADAIGSWATIDTDDPEDVQDADDCSSDLD